MTPTTQSCATTVLLNRGYHALVDLEDLERVLTRRWRVHFDRGRWYALSHVPGSGRRGRDESMHRFIMRARAGELIDHQNGDGLDNRKVNLRRCTNAQNVRNQRKHRDKRTSKYKGVAFMRDRDLYRAQIMHQRVKINLGDFADEQCAVCETIAAYRWHIRRLNGKEPKFGGLPDHPATLCGATAAWDVNVNVDDKARRAGCCCKKCAEAYLKGCAQ